ncbi:GDSL-type esterase/lipase family protein [Streptomyces violaceusniger]|uniref:GDSL-type esterase/lipase family protein n=1 Tax=Streptomyces violaceusniger TaxID=68280 RepID=UPI00344AADB7
MPAPAGARSSLPSRQGPSDTSTRQEKTDMNDENERASGPLSWEATWAQALPDVCADGEWFADVTLRSHLRVGIGGEQVRLEFSNQFGDHPVRIGRSAVSAGGRTAVATFGGRDGVTIPVGASVSTDPVEMPVGHHATVDVDFYLPERTLFPPLFTGVSDFTCQLSEPGDHVGAATFPAVAAPPFPMPDDADISVHESGPFLRTVEVAGDARHAVVVCVGDSITAMGWPEVAAGLLPEGSGLSVVNRGVPGNRLRLDAGPANLSNGRSGLSRFKDDVLGTAGVAQVVIALGTNDLGLPGEFEPIEELPTAAELIAGYETLLEQAGAAGIRARIATITPRVGSDSYDDGREQTRSAVNDWIRGLGPDVAIDFDEALRSAASPLQLDQRYDSGDCLHPSDTGQEQLARTVVAALLAGTSQQEPAVH